MRRVLLIACIVAMAAPVAADPVGRLIYAQGKAQIVRNLKAVPPAPGTVIEGDDLLRAQVGGRLKVILDDDSLVMVWDDSEMRFQNTVIDLMQARRQLQIEQITGQLRLVVSSFLGSGEILVRTPNARVFVDDAADLLIRQGVQGDDTEIVVLAGRARVEHVFTDFSGAVELEAQQTTIVGTDRAPTAPLFVDRSVFEQVLQDLRWILPEPVPDWDGFFGQHLEDYAVRAFGRIRRLAQRPMTPIRTMVEGLSEAHLPQRPAEPRPEPRSTLDLRWNFQDVEQ
ncbi:MAG: hypothetical protein D6761_10525 [Candidatus Dadabacteria bacterium]|nr:MAG: hypothetical protein D6761_10525 [Candidatus Dadabacteria bacterium]